MLHNGFRDNKDKNAVIILTVVFVISRLILKALGITFYGAFVKRMWQAIDIELLKNDFLQSLFYSHAQPPLFNLLTGILVKIFPDHYTLVYHLISLTLTWGTVLLIYFSLRKMDVNWWWSLFTGLYCMLSPSVILYENLYSYTLMTVFMLTACAYLLIHFIKDKKISQWVLLWILLVSVVLLRSSFHLVWLLGIFIMFLLFHDALIPFRRLAMIAAAAILLASLWYFKNWIVFGKFTASTWLGMNMARIMPPDSGPGRSIPFRPLEEYETHPVGKRFAVKLLNEPYKTYPKFVNYFHIGYISISESFRREVIKEIKMNPAQYLSRVKEAFIIYFNPASHAPFTDGNHQRIRYYASWYNIDFSGYTRFGYNPFSTTQAIPAFVLHLLVFGITFIGFVKHVFQRDDKHIILLLLFILAYGMLVCNILEYGENNRFRFETSTVFMILTIKVFHTLWKVRRVIQKKV